MKAAFDLFLTFAKVGLFTFGGGYAMITLIEDICVGKKHWITHDEMMTVTVMAESTPGPIAINCATYVGYRQAGITGAVAATVGVVLPSFCVIFAVSVGLKSLLEIAWVAHAFIGIRIAVGILILDAALRMIGKMRFKRLPCAILTGGFFVMLSSDIFSLHISSIVLMLVAAVVAVVVFSLRQYTGQGKVVK